MNTRSGDSEPGQCETLSQAKGAGLRLEVARERCEVVDFLADAMEVLFFTGIRLKDVKRDVERLTRTR